MTSPLRPATSLDLLPSTDLAEAVGQIRAAVVASEAERYRASVLDFVGAHPDALLRSCSAGHLTGSALVVDPARSRTLLMLHRKLGRWFQPGGHADGEANLAAVALDEATEETGIRDLGVLVPAFDIDVHRVPLLGQQPHLHLDLRFLALAPPGSVEVPNAESTALRWVDGNDLDDLHPAVDPATRRLITRGLALVAERAGPPA